MAPLLNIRAIRSRAVAVPMRFALGTSAQSVRAAPLLLVDLETEQGITGRTYVFCYMPMGAALVARVLEEAQTAIKGAAVEPAKIAARLARHFRLIATTGVIGLALSAVDVACWDALAIAAGKPLVEFLGGKRHAIPAYNSNGLGLMAAEKLADEAEALLDGGFRALKLRLGYETRAADLAALRAVRKRLPDGVAIMSDYNQALTVDEALERGRALDGEGLAWIEEPIEHDDYAGCARIARELATPVQIGENFAGPNAMAAAIGGRAADCMMPDVLRIGGVSGWLQAASLAAEAKVPLSSHLLPEVSAALLGVSPTAHWLEYVDWAGAILAEPLRVVNGTVAPPDVPGSGVSWNEDAVARYRME
ncbi:MAG TPA: enolase C-terminal domain-like protein [Candidatus Sulfopaludibacter sp.]|nr:enolase C-terminal domain-like protein [Candidatus Sulfopaludibacter sp.]